MDQPIPPGPFDARYYLRMYVLCETACTNLETNPDACVSKCSSVAFPGVCPGMPIVAINCTVVKTAAELQAALQDAKSKGPLLDIVFATDGEKAKSLRCRPQFISKLPVTALESPEDDLFDIDSDNDEPSSEVEHTKKKPVISAVSFTDPAFAGGGPTSVVLDAAARVPPGRCIVVLVQDINPSLHIENAARVSSVPFLRLNAAARVHSRHRRSSMIPSIQDALENGTWIILEQANKSMSLLDLLVGTMKDVHQRGTVRSTSRVFILCEPHPHFPPYLLQDCVTLRFSSLTHALEETLHGSNSRIDVLRGDTPPSSLHEEIRKVRMAPTVDVVVLESSEILGQSKHPVQEDSPAEQCGLHVAQKYKSRGVKYTCSSVAGETQNLRVAVGSNTGAVKVIGYDGLALAEYQAANSCIWGMNCPSELEFSIACQDGTVAIMQYELSTQQLQAHRAEVFHEEMFAVVIISAEEPEGVVVAGGLFGTLCIMPAESEFVVRIPLDSSIQALCTLPHGNVFFACGNGQTGVVDPEKGVVVSKEARHQKKVPSVAAHGSIVATGSYDQTLKLWDLRSKALTHTLLMPGFVTGVALDENMLCACAGPSLVLWDTRFLNTPLHFVKRAWSGLTRGLQLFESAQAICTASTDGVVRWWSY